jgi:hypothetical protein
MIMRLWNIFGGRPIVGAGGGAVIVCAMIAMIAVSMKQMHQWAGKQEKERKNPEQMGAVFGQQEK